jgi:hypothetical protein
MLKNTILAGAIVLATGSAALAQNYNNHNHGPSVTFDPNQVNYSQSTGNVTGQGGGIGFGKVNGSGTAGGLGGGIAFGTAGGSTTNAQSATTANGCQQNCQANGGIGFIGGNAGNLGPAIAVTDNGGTQSNAQVGVLAGGVGGAQSTGGSAFGGAKGSASVSGVGTSISITGQGEGDVTLPLSSAGGQNVGGNGGH